MFVADRFKRTLPASAIDRLIRGNVRVLRDSGYFPATQSEYCFQSSSCIVR